MNSNPSSESTVAALVSGRVQGVGYRYFVLQQARRLKLAGAVANRPDGRVQVRARGPRESLEELLAELRRGPYMAKIEDLKIEWNAPCPETEDFKVEF